MDTHIDRVDVELPAAKVWPYLTSRERLAEFCFGLQYDCAWRNGAALRIYYLSRLVAEGTIVHVEAPHLLIYRLDEPETGDVDSWVTWQLEPTPTGTSVTYVVDSLCGPAPDYGQQLLAN